jgi:hypothetical protein
MVLAAAHRLKIKRRPRETLLRMPIIATILYIIYRLVGLVIFLVIVNAVISWLIAS